MNSLNQRLGYLRHWLRKRQPDIVALQKIRVSRKRWENLPRKEIEAVGYHVEELLADSQLASVAVLVRQGFLKDEREPKVRQRGLPGRETDGRLLIVDVAGVRVASVYVPYAPCGSSTKAQVGRSIQAKVNWLHGLSKCVADQSGAPKPTFLCGDFNVVLDGGSTPNTLNRSPEERQALVSLCASGFIDIYRASHRDGRPGFNSGTPITGPPDARLHLILGTASVARHVNSARVDIEYRGPLKDLPGERWAPGAPLIVEVDDGLI